MQANDLLLSSVQSDLSLNASINDYLISEKLDGIRAFWDGKHFVTRSGNKLNAPEWFVQGFPSIPLDGELWAGRSGFQHVARTVLDTQPKDEDWQRITFMVYDTPTPNMSFADRYQLLHDKITTLNHHHIQVIEQFAVDDIKQLEKRLSQTVEHGGEGLMLHHKKNHYELGRSEQLLKLKEYQDAEAKVIGYEEGKGKYTGMMGAIWVKTADNVTFKIGTGFKDSERESPPPLGSMVNYRYNGKTEKGIPRFARFVRIRNNPDI
ncbi:ATP-dependent DNA ligase [Photobacterium jeanii]|uniref:ATP-dependent DNA ligase n=2 Tax=Photobacterium jeanii TaxID=858640 RepID=A0A178K354_9GAMM|nr:ATP-dependent DNA ligase [Photobacterium jeanii]